jgi:hypothetical protein
LPVYDSVVVSGVPQEPIKLKPEEDKSIKIRFRNNGGLDWLPNFAIYQIGDRKISAFKNGVKSISTGHCKVKSFKPIDLVLLAPKESGKYTF